MALSYVPDCCNSAGAQAHVLLSSGGVGVYLRGRRGAVTISGVHVAERGGSVGTVLWTALGPSAPFLVGGTVKIAHDLRLWWMSRQVKPLEEVADG